jgi:hypothetical protein
LSTHELELELELFGIFSPQSYKALALLSLSSSLNSSITVHTENKLEGHHASPFSLVQRSAGAELCENPKIRFIISYASKKTSNLHHHKTSSPLQLLFLSIALPNKTKYEKRRQVLRMTSLPLFSKKKKKDNFTALCVCPNGYAV